MQRSAESNMPNSGLVLLLIWNLAISQISSIKLEKISQQSSNVLVDFFAYRHISIIHFDVPANTVTAVFKFTAKEDKTGGIGKCKPRDVSLYLKPGSIPLVRPDKAIIKANLLTRRHRYSELQISSDGTSHNVTVGSPPPGDWFAIAFRAWKDPNTGKITQEGLAVSCDTLLDAELLIEETATAAVVGSETTHRVQLNNSANSAILQYFLDKKFKEPSLHLSSSCDDVCNIAVNVTSKEYLAGTVLNASTAVVPFEPYADSFHYVTLRLTSGESSNVSVTLREESRPNSAEAITLTKLVRKSLPDFFLFDYEHLPRNASKPAPVNLTTETLTILSFRVGPVYDVGGTLTVGLKLPEIEAKKKREDVLVVGCISFGYYARVTDAASCTVTGKKPTPPSLHVNKTAPSFVHIPFPEPGYWHVSLKSFCVAGNCSCAKNCTNSACLNCECMKECNSSVEVSISSSPCIEGQCNSKGRCIHYMSGGFVFSSCHCSGGYRGFDCADNKYVLNSSSVMASLLLLTLSNLAFVGSIYVAIRRQYYTEAVAYTAVLFFSTFYHACEAGDEVFNFCVMRLSVLQFCDFFNALLAIWVTLVAMAAFGPRLTAFCQIAGAILIAMGAEMDRTSLWVFLMPAITGCILIGVSWGKTCKQKRSYRYPARPYRSIFLPAGLLLVFVGLLCYAFFQTRQNYYIVHSFWHMCVAGGVVLLLPKRECMK